MNLKTKIKLFLLLLKVHRLTYLDLSTVDILVEYPSQTINKLYGFYTQN